MINEDVIINVSWKGKNNLLATANVCLATTLFGDLNIKGFTIWKSDLENKRLQEPINIKPPSVRSYGRYREVVFFEDENHWFEIERKIYGKFIEVRTKIESEEEIDLDEIEKGIDDMSNE